MEVCEWVVMEVASAREYLGHREVGARVQLAVQVGEDRVLERRELVVVEGHLEAVEPLQVRDRVAGDGLVAAVGGRRLQLRRVLPPEHRVLGQLLLEHPEPPLIGDALPHARAAGGVPLRVELLG